MEKNPALTLFRVLRHEATNMPLTDTEVRKKTGFNQIELDIAAEELEAEGMLVIQRSYLLVED